MSMDMGASERVLASFERFLRERKLAGDRQLPYLVGWVKGFLELGRRNGEPASDETLLAYLRHLNGMNRYKEWQLQQAEDAVKIYLHQFRDSDECSGETKKVKHREKSVALRDAIPTMENAMRLRHYAPRTVKTYRNWALRFLDYRTESGLTKSVEAQDVKSFLTHLAVRGRVSASTQNQAFNAILFLCRYVLRVPLDEMDKTVRAKRKRRLPTVLSTEEVKQLLNAVEPKYGLMVKLIYGSGVRLMELVQIRIKDFDFEGHLLFVRGGKGDKDRTTLLPVSLNDELHEHLTTVRRWHEEDLARGLGEAPLPEALGRKYPNAGRDWGWQYAFPADKVGVDPSDGKLRRYHVYHQTVRAAVQRAARKTDIPKHVTPHALRHYAASLIMPTVLAARRSSAINIGGSLGLAVVRCGIIRGSPERPRVRRRDGSVLA